MKKIYFSAFLTILFFGKSFSQNTDKFLNTGATTSNWTYLARTITGSSDGGAIFVHENVDSISRVVSYSLIKTDSLFSLQWAKTIANLPATSIINGISETNSGNYCLFASDNGGGTNNYEIQYLITFDLNGNLLWTRAFSIPFNGDYAAPKIKQNSSGEYVMLVSQYDHMGYLWLDQNGHFIKGEGIKADSLESKNPSFDFNFRNDSTIVMSGKANNDNYFVELTRSGNLLSSNRYTDLNSYNQPRAMHVLSTGEYLVCGLYFDNLIGTTGGFFMKMDANQNILWRKLYNSSLFSSFAFKDFVTDTNGDNILFDEYGQFALRVDQNGNVINAKITDGNNIAFSVYNNSVFTSANRLDAASGLYVPSLHKSALNMNDLCLYFDYNGFFATSPAYNPTITTGIFRYPIGGPDSATTIMLINDSFTYTTYAGCNGVGIAENKLNANFSVFPNPASESVTVSLSNLNSTETIFVNVIDVSGKLISSERISSGTSTFQCSTKELENGIYFLRLTENGKVIGNKKLVVVH